jgi:hypothetical protein
MIVERMIQKVIPGKFAELEAFDQKIKPLEARFGFPPKRRMRCMIGGHNTDTMILEREWESLAALEAAYNKAWADPEHQASRAETVSLIKSIKTEIYMLL